MPPRTALHRLADAQLPGGGLDQFVTDSRAQGMPWRDVAHRLHTATGGRVRISWETLRRWYADTAEDAA